MSNILAVVLFSLSIVHAADIDGKWFAKVPRGAGAPVDTTFTFAVQGTALTGMIANSLTGVPAERPIRDGKVQGNTISFTVQNAQNGDQMFKGTLAGDEFKMTRSGPSGRIYEFIAKRMK